MIPRNATPVFRAVFCTALLLLLGMVAPGCKSGSPGEMRAQKAVASIKETRQHAVDGQKLVDSINSSLTQLTSQPTDLRKPFGQLRKDIRSVDRLSEDAKRRLADMRARASNYQESWAMETERLSSPDLKASSLERQERVRQRFAGIEASLDQVRAAYNPYVSDLKEIETVLSNDLTYAGVRSASQSIERAVSEGELLKQRLGVLSTRLEEVSTVLSPTTVPAAKR